MPDGNETNCVCILNGIHRGAVIRVGDTPVSVGGTPGCDAVLADDSIADHCVVLSRGDDDNIVVTLRDGSAAIGMHAVRSERPASLVKGAVLRMGDVRIAKGAEVDCAQQDVQARDKRRTARNWVVAMAASLLLVGGVGALGGGAADAYIGDEPAPRSFFVSTSNRTANVDASNALQRKIDEMDLSNSVSIKPLAFSDQILVTGAVTPSERERMSSVIRWFDGSFGGRVMLETDLQDRDTALVVPFRIVSVVVAPNPHIEIQDGRIFPIGSVLPGGWEIQGIADMKVVLVRGNKELKIAF